MANLVLLLLVATPFVVTILIGTTFDRESRRRSPDQGDEIKEFFAGDN